jgi:3-oxoadipate enol-lactonase
MSRSDLVSDVESDGARIRYYVSGVVDGPALLLAHSLGASSEIWTPQLPLLERRFRVVRYDARGHGASSVPGGEYSLSELGHDALAVLEKAATGRTAVCGISMGGQVAIWLAVHAPDRVDRIALANTAARIGTPQGWTERIEAVRAHDLTAVAAAVRGRWLTPAYADANPEVVEMLVGRLMATTPAGYVGCCAAMRDADLGDDLSRISARVLVIAGDYAPATTVADARALCDGVPDARMVRLATAHLSNIEDADGFTRELLAFLEEGRTDG